MTEKRIKSANEMVNDDLCRHSLVKCSDVHLMFSFFLFFFVLYSCERAKWHDGMMICRLEQKKRISTLCYISTMLCIIVLASDHYLNWMF